MEIFNSSSNLDDTEIKGENVHIGTESISNKMNKTPNQEEGKIKKMENQGNWSIEFMNSGFEHQYKILDFFQKNDMDSKQDDTACDFYIYNENMEPW